jgi:hypothetical protein
LITPAPVNLTKSQSSNELDNVGYPYRDVVERPQPINLGQALSSEMTVDFSIRDFKYMSNKNQTLTVTTNPAQMNGSANITFPLNF